MCAVSAWDELCDFRPTVAQIGLRFHEEVVLFFRPWPFLQGGRKVIVPTFPALLADPSWNVLCNLAPLCHAAVDTFPNGLVFLLSPVPLDEPGLHDPLPSCFALLWSPCPQEEIARDYLPSPRVCFCVIVARRREKVRHHGLRFLNGSLQPVRFDRRGQISKKAGTAAVRQGLACTSSPDFLCFGPPTLHRIAREGQMSQVHRSQARKSWIVVPEAVKVWLRIGGQSTRLP
eukprot:scaffold48_cov311-Pinguiococcus_pyrenoidosus.AAC.270